MTPQRERLAQAAAFHDEADTIRALFRMIHRLERKSRPLHQLQAYAKFCRRMARNNERAYERNSH